jgi:hypothetical protein
MYTLDAAEAKKADQKGGYINETGKYKGKFTRVEELTAATGTQGVGFTFVSDEGLTANFSVYTIKSDGTPLMGKQFVMALMACLSLRSTGEPVMKPVKRYDYNTKQNYEEDAPLFTAMMDKPIGLLLQSCEYEKERDRVKTGEFGWKIEPYAPFQAATELMATEVLNKAAKPEMLAKMVAGLKDRPLKGRAHLAKEAAPQTSAGAPSMPDDDIPF